MWVHPCRLLCARVFDRDNRINTPTELSASLISWLRSRFHVPELDNLDNSLIGASRLRHVNTSTKEYNGYSMY